MSVGQTRKLHTNLHTVFTVDSDNLRSSWVCLDVQTPNGLRHTTVHKIGCNIRPACSICQRRRFWTSLS
ncbi:unnamed protein product [Thelazia callipaeda]|uniref:Uncharacterized protein n=1 Tax=Thelazia callipaeda TaxID=103827 RepID=A0A0N5CMF5_THECL|nr:unnamed protein product [Thelazia callipaeda]